MKQKKNNEELLQQLYKTYSNSIYGKLAQGIAEKVPLTLEKVGRKDYQNLQLVILTMPL